MADVTREFSERLRCAATAALPGFKVKCEYTDYGNVAYITLSDGVRPLVVGVVPTVATLDELTMLALNLRLAAQTSDSMFKRADADSEADDAPPWSGAGDASNALKSHADACAAKSERLNETLADDVATDPKVLQAMRKASASRAVADIVGRLVGGWNKHTDWHFSTTAPCGTRIDLWPSTCKAQAHVGDGEFSRATGARHVAQFLRNYKVLK